MRIWPGGRLPDARLAAPRPTTPSRRRGCGWTAPTSSDVQNLRGWLTTVVARICLDMLRSRTARPRGAARRHRCRGPHRDRRSGRSGTARRCWPTRSGSRCSSCSSRLSPAERLAFVLHDMFDLPFAEIAPIVGRSENTAAQLAARARRRVRGQTPDPATDLVRQRRLVDAFLTAARDGDFGSLLAALDTDVVLRVDAAAAGSATTIRGAQAARPTRAPSPPSSFAEPAQVQGAVGIVVAPGQACAGVAVRRRRRQDLRDRHRGRPKNDPAAGIGRPGLIGAHTSMELLTGLGQVTASGLNAYIPLLALGLLSRFTDLITLPHGWVWLENGWVMAIVAVLLVIEVVADKIPALDSVNDANPDIRSPDLRWHRVRFRHRCPDARRHRPGRFRAVGSVDPDRRRRGWWRSWCR